MSIETLPKRVWEARALCKTNDIVLASAELQKSKSKFNFDRDRALVFNKSK